MPKQVRINIRSVANAKAIKHEKRNGRDIIIVPSATLPDDVIMNGIKYPADEIEKSFKSLERTPAPLGHPMINNRFVSASDPEGINIGYVGAWNENVRRADGRVYLDKIIDVEVANRTEAGKGVLNAIDKGGPIHTSTGLLCELEAVNGDDTHQYIARNMLFDHDAILIGEEGAATPEQGVGMLVNGKEIEVINSAVDWVDRDLDWALLSALDALDRREKATMVERLKAALIEAFMPLRKQPLNESEDDMADDKQLEELSAKVNGLAEKFEGIPDLVANAIKDAVKPLTDNLTEVQNAQKARDDAEKAELVEKVVKANVLDEDAAKELSLVNLRKLAEKAKAGKAAALNGAGKGSPGDDEFAEYDLNANFAKKEA